MAHEGRPTWASNAATSMLSLAKQLRSEGIFVLALLLTAAAAPETRAQVYVPRSRAQIWGATSTLRIYTTFIEDFVLNFGFVGPIPARCRALDFDRSGSELWGILDGLAPAPPRVFTSARPGTTSSNVFHDRGELTGPGSVSGLTCSPAGTWYLIEDTQGDSVLWRGDVTTKDFTRVGTATGVGRLADIAADASGRLFAVSETLDALVRLDPLNGSATVIGPLGIPIEGEQGLDFDWSTGELLGTLHRGQGATYLARIDTLTGRSEFVASAVFSNLEMEFALDVGYGVRIDSSYCSPAIPNSAGSAGHIAAFGNLDVTRGSLRLLATGLPRQSFGYFLTSRTMGFVPAAGGGVGTLCLGGAIGRYVGPGQVRSSSLEGAFALDLSLERTPQPGGEVAITAGETWHFQAWYRDAIGGVATSNLTDASTIIFAPNCDDPLFVGTSAVRFGSTTSLTDSSLVIAGDFDRDGDSDIICRGPVGSPLLQFQNLGAGRLSLPFAVADSEDALALATADLDRNGALDIILLTADRTALQVYEGRGDGTFVRGARIALGAATQQLGVGDVDGDGNLDLLCKGPTVFQVHVAFGDGSGGFTPPRLDLLAVALSDFAVVDLNNDGRDDLVTIKNDRVITAQLSSPAGWVAVSSNAPAGFVPSGLTIGDLDGDGDPDLFLATTASTGSVTMRNDGNGSFSVLESQVVALRGGVELLDFDLDGDLDVAGSLLSLDHFVAILVNDGTGRLSLSQQAPTPGPVSRCIAEDMDGDSRLDVVATSGTAIAVLRNAGGTISKAIEIAIGAGVTSCAAVDFDGDGRSELVTANPTIPSLTVWGWQGGTGFAPQFDLLPGISQSVIRVGDLDGDGDSDLAVGESGAAVVHILRNLGSGAFQAPLTISVAAPASDLMLRDLDADGDADLVHHTTDGVLRVYTQDSSGNFSLTYQAPSPLGTGGVIVPFDTNADGRVDILRVGGFDWLVGFEADGAGGYAPRVIDPNSRAVIAAAVDDINRDGYDDVVSLTQSFAPIVNVVYGSAAGPGSPVSLGNLQLRAGADVVLIADIQRDGIKDVIVTRSTQTWALGILEQSTTSRWIETTRLAVDTTISTAAAGDFNGDGAVDIVTIAGDRLYLHLNECR